MIDFRVSNLRLYFLVLQDDTLPFRFSSCLHKIKGNHLRNAITEHTKGPFCMTSRFSQDDYSTFCC